MAVSVLDRSGKPLMPCSEKRAKLLLARNRARVHRVLPFVIRLVDRTQSDCALQPLRIKLDPGSKAKHCRIVQRGDGFGYSLLSTTGKDNFPVSSHNQPTRSRAEVAAQPCG